MIDTPLGKIDKEYRTQVLDSFPQIMNKSQLILLVTSSEYTKEVKSKVKSIADNLVEYEIIRDKYQNRIIKRS